MNNFAFRRGAWVFGHGYLALYLMLTACSLDIGKLRAPAHDSAVQADTPPDFASPPWDLGASELSARDVPGIDLYQGDLVGSGPSDTAPHDSQAGAETASPPDVPSPPEVTLDAGVPDVLTDDTPSPSAQDGGLVDPADAGAGEDVDQATDGADASEPDTVVDGSDFSDADDAAAANDTAVASDARDLGSRDALVPVTFEAPSLTRSSSSIGSEVNPDFGGGCPTTPCQYVQFTSGRTPSRGDWIEFTLPGLDAGNYSATLDYKSAYNRGIVQVSLDGVSLAVTCDLFSGDFIYDARCNLGTVTVPTSGPHLLRLTVTGKNSSSGGYVVAIERFTFAPM